MIEIIPIMLGLVAVLVMTTLGAVLAIRVFLASMGRTARTLAAAVLGTAIPVGAMLLIGLSEGNFEAELVIGIVAGIAGPILMVGWPTAFFATRKLDKLTEQRASVFE